MKKTAAMFLTGLMVCTGWCQAVPAQKFALHKLFSSHLVFQRDKPIHVFGTATPGGSVTVIFAGKTVTAIAAPSGRWLAEFPAMKAGTGYTLEIAGADPQKKVMLNDVAIGEVWLCSGQSNMQMPVLSSSPFWRTANAEEEVQNANWPNIREFHVVRNWSPGLELNELKGTAWQVCNPQNVKTFSALGYFFARQLYQDLKIPVGIIHSSFGGTNIMAWMPQEAFIPAGQDAALSQIQQARQVLGNQSPQDFERDFQQKIKLWRATFETCSPAATKTAENWKKPDFDDSGWKSWSPDQTDAELLPRVTWYRNTIYSLPASYAAGQCVISIPAFVGNSEIYLNGKLVGKTDIMKPIGYFQKSHSFTVAAGVVQPGKNVIAIRLGDYYGKDVTRFHDVNYTRIAQGRSGQNFESKKWKMKTEFSVDPAKLSPCPAWHDPAITSWGYPGTLFNGMIAPLTTYPIRGVVWYQGESDAYFAGLYYRKHRELIHAWRERWHNPTMPFILVQLAGCERHTPQNRLPDGFWKSIPPINDDGIVTHLREGQEAIGCLPGVGLITAVDVGDHSDVHPRDKQTLGFRAAKEAERLAYGIKIISRGPTYRNMKVEGSKIRIFFDQIGGGLVTRDGALPHAFAIAGKDGKYIWADAVIDNNTIIVSSPQVTSPVNVRYAWAKFRPDLNLINKEGLPAFPFRTDAPKYK